MMNKFTISEGLMDYYSKPDIAEAVDSLVDKLNGKNPPELSWEESQKYNRALLMAAQVRADYVDLLYRIWEETFGAHDRLDDLRGEYFYSYGFSISEIWKDKWLERTYYRNGNPDEGGKNDTLLVSTEGDKLSLQVWRYKDEDSPARPGRANDAEGWKYVKKDGDNYFITEKHVSMKKFVENPDEYIVEFRKAAKSMIDKLLEQP